jgi:hypothetical protein
MYCKLTNKNNKTRNDFQWGENVTHTATGSGKELCSDGFIHFYIDPLIAVIFNPIHANFENPNLWECETYGEEIHEPVKSGCKTLTTIKQIPLPEVTLTQKIAFAILCAKEIYKDENWNKWADGWLNGKDRSSTAAYAAYATAYAANYATADEAADAAIYAARDAAHSSKKANIAATTAAYAANYATRVGAKFNVVKIANEALKY